MSIIEYQNVKCYVQIVTTPLLNNICKMFLSIFHRKYWIIFLHILICKLVFHCLYCTSYNWMKFQSIVKLGSNIIHTWYYHLKKGTFCFKSTQTIWAALQTKKRITTRDVWRNRNSSGEVIYQFRIRGTASLFKSGPTSTRNTKNVKRSGWILNTAWK